MAGKDATENDTFGRIAQKQTKYGSTTKYTERRCRYFEYKLQRNDTLQALSLKFGISIGEIKRINKIWSNEDLCVRDFISLPIEETAEKHLPHNPASSVVNDNFIHGNMVKSQSLPFPSSINTPAEKDPMNYLKKFDTSLSEAKERLKQLKSHSSVANDPSNPLNYLPKKKSQHYGTRNQSHHSMDAENSMFIKDFSAEPTLVIRSSPHGTVKAPAIRNQYTNGWDTTEEEISQL